MLYIGFDGTAEGRSALALWAELEPPRSSAYPRYDRTRRHSCGRAALSQERSECDQAGTDGRRDLASSASVLRRALHRSNRKVPLYSNLRRAHNDGHAARAQGSSEQDRYFVCPHRDDGVREIIATTARGGEKIFSQCGA